MFDNNIIDLQEIDRKLNPPETREEVEYKREIMKAVIDRAGIRGFFHGQVTPEPTGIVLDYDVEEVKRELGGVS
jgi:hypothetical protein